MIRRFAQLLCSNNFSRIFSVIKRLLSWRSQIKLAANPYNGLVVGRHPEGDWRLVVRVNEQEVFAGPIDKTTAPDLWKTVDVDLSGSAMKIAAMFRESEPDRTTQIDIAEGLTARGDTTLLDTVLQNLIGNALKYTAKKPEALVTFGKVREQGQDVFYVRDNGEGFDMAYKDKLFLPFERLHGAEFEGTGIGLATVKRIIDRHGGRIWAEGEPGKGATFYFTLSPAGRT